MLSVNASASSPLLRGLTFISNHLHHLYLSWVSPLVFEQLPVFCSIQVFLSIKTGVEFSFFFCCTAADSVEFLISSEVTLPAPQLLSNLDSHWTSAYYRIIEYLKLEGTCNDHWVQLLLFPRGEVTHREENVYDLLLLALSFCFHLISKLFLKHQFCSWQMFRIIWLSPYTLERFFSFLCHSHTDIQTKF